MRFRYLLAGVVLPLLLWASLPLVSAGAPKESAATIQSKINKKQAELNKKLGKERVLSSTVAGYSGRINKLEAKIKVLRAKQDTIQKDLNSKREELADIQTDLRAERKRLARLRTRLAEGREVLAARLRELYESDPPDLVTVVLDSEGFADLLERGEFLKRIEEQDKRVIRDVTNAKAETEKTAAQLDDLESRQQKITARVLIQRNAVDSVRTDLVKTQDPLRNARAAKNKVLTGVKEDRRETQEDLEVLEKASAKIAGELQGIVPTQPVKGGNGPWIWPVTGPITGKFGEPRPGHMHAGLDISAPAGTPIRAVANGRVVLMQPTGASGGYGNYTCVQHTSSLASCYAHQIRFGTTKGATVRKGQVIGYVGNTGNSFGNHLHFEARVNGTPVQPLNYL